MYNGPNIVTDGLVLALDAANVKSYPKSGTVLKDLSGNVNNGTLVNGPTYNSDNLGSISFDGVNDVISLNNSLFSNFNNDNSLTLNIFVNINEPTLLLLGGLFTNQRYFTEGDPGGFGFVIINNGNLAVNLTKTINGVSSSYQNLAQFPFNREQTSLYSFTYNSVTKTVTTYKNGIQQATTTNSNYGWTKNTVNRSTLIGANTQGGWGGRYKMNINNISLYNRALSATEVLQNYNATKSRYGL
jgi:hypothetical protein